MTKETLALHWQNRHEWTDRYLASPENFKVCYQCLTIRSKSAPGCHLCGCYRFYEDPGLVRCVARKMATVPWPRGAGVVPRLFAPAVAPQKTALAQAFKTEWQPQTVKPSMTPKTPVLTKVPYEFPKERARAFMPSPVGTRAIKVYSMAPMFWAVIRMGEGCYRVQLGTFSGICDQGYLVTAQAAADYICHTNHLPVLLHHLKDYGWNDLAALLEKRLPALPTMSLKLGTPTNAWPAKTDCWQPHVDQNN